MFSACNQTYPTFTSAPASHRATYLADAGSPVRHQAALTPSGRRAPPTRTRAGRSRTRTDCTHRGRRRSTQSHTPCDCDPVTPRDYVTTRLRHHMITSLVNNHTITSSREYINTRLRYFSSQRSHRAITHVYITTQYVSAHDYKIIL